MKEKLVCKYCNKTFLVSPSRLNKRVFCSLHCRSKWQSENENFKAEKNPNWSGGSKESKCLICGRIILDNQARDRKYCSRKCYYKKMSKVIGELNHSWKGGKPKCKTCGVEINRKRLYCHKHKHVLCPERGKKVSEKLAGRMPKNLYYPGKFRNVVRGIFDINGKKMFFRSRWEANYALYLDFLLVQKQITKWEYEKDCFVFEAIKFGTRSYRPDFKIYNNDGTVEYHEVKGWMDKRSETKLKRMAKYFPHVKIVLIDSKAYGEILTKVGGLINAYCKPLL